VLRHSIAVYYPDEGPAKKILKQALKGGDQMGWRPKHEVLTCSNKGGCAAYDKLADENERLRELAREYIALVDNDIEEKRLKEIAKHFMQELSRDEEIPPDARDVLYKKFQQALTPSDKEQEQ